MTTTTRDAPAIAPWIGLGAAVVLVVAAVVTPRVFHWNVYVARFPPLLADPHPHLGPGTPLAVAVAALTVLFGGRLAQRSPWPLVLLLSFVVAAVWTFGLATVGGLDGIARVLTYRSEYLPTAHTVTDIGAMIHRFTARIPLTSSHHWAVNVAGHPPGALLVFVLLVRIGLGSGLAAGLVVIVVAATTPAAVLVCVRRLGAEAAARRMAPFLTVGPAAVWIGVSADAMFAAPAAWGLCCLAVGATAKRRRVRWAGAAAAGLLLGLSAFLSWGLPLIGLVAIAVLVLARTWRPILVAVGAALVVVAAFAVAGFVWWDAYPVLVHRYWAGIATFRPGLYWVWADLAVLAISAGPAVAAGTGAALARLPTVRRLPVDTRVVVILTLAAVAVIASADASSLSRAEVERIWQPFVPWLLVGTALLPPRWRRFALAADVVTGLAVEHLLHTAW